MEVWSKWDEKYNATNYDSKEEAIAEAIDRLNDCIDICGDKEGINLEKVTLSILQKQYSKKAIKLKIVKERLTGHCPICDSLNYSSNKYCINCGQKLGWK